MNKLKKVAKWSLKIIVSIFVILTVLLILLTLPPGETFIRLTLQKQLGSALDQTVKIEKFETNLISRIQFSDLQIYQLKDQTRVPFISLGFGRVDYRLWNLLKKKISIESIKLERLDASIIQDSSGFVNLPVTTADTTVAVQEDTTASGYQLELEQLILDETTVSYNNTTIPVKGVLNKLRVGLFQKDQNQYRFQTEVDSGGLVYQQSQIPLRKIAIQGIFSDGDLRIDSLLMDFPGINLNGFASVDFSESPSPLNGEIHIRGDIQTVSNSFKPMIPEALFPIQGNLYSTIKLTGTVEQPQITTQMSVPDLNIANLSFQKGSLSANLGTKEIVLQQFDIGFMDGKISAKGNVQLDQRFQHRLSLSATKLDLSLVWQSIYQDASPFEGFVNTSVESSGPLNVMDSLRLKANLNLQKIKYKSKSLKDFSTKINYQNGLARLNFEQGENKISADAKIKQAEIDGKYSVDIQNVNPLAAFAGVYDVFGKFKSSGSFSGPVAAPRVLADFSGENLSYQNFPLDNVEGGLSYRDSIINIKETEFSGKLTVIDTLNPPFGIPEMTGGFSYKGNIEGDLDNLQGEILATFDTTAFQDYRFNQGKLWVVMDGQTVKLKELQLLQDSLAIGATGGFSLSDLSGDVRMNFHPPAGSYGSADTAQTGIPENYSEGAKLGELISKFNFSDSLNWMMAVRGEELHLSELVKIYPEKQEIEGQLDFDFNFRGNLKSPNAQLFFHLDSAKYAQVEIDSVNGKAKLQQHRLSVDSLNIFLKGYQSWATGSIEMVQDSAGHYTINERSPTRGEIENTDFELKLLSPFMGEDFEVRGISQYHLSWDGNLKNPGLAGYFKLRNGYFQMRKDAPAIQNVLVDLSLDQSMLNIDNVSGEFGKTPFVIKGKISLEKTTDFETTLNLNVADRDVLNGSGSFTDDQLDFNLTIDKFDISPFQGFIPNLKSLTGLMNAKMDITGGYSSPEISGYLRISDIGFQPELMSSGFTGGLIDINFSRERINVDSVYLKKEEGHVLVTGSLSHNEGQLTDLKIQTDINKLNLNYQKQYKVLIKKARLNYRKLSNKYKLNGQIVLGESQFTYNIEPKNIIEMVNSVEMPVQEPPLLLKQTELDVRMTDSENIWLDNNLARLRFHPEISLVGTLARPTVTGRIRVTEGYVFYLDRKFEVEKAIMDFTDPNDINPIVDLKAVATVKSYQALEDITYIITFSITGPMDNSIITLSSDPPLSQSSILSLLTFGATQEQLTGGATSGQDVSTSDILKQRIASLSSRRISGYVSGKVGNLLGLEEFAIQGNLFNFEQAGGPRLIAAKRISDRLKVTYMTNVGQLNDFGIRMDYKLTEHFSLQGLTDQRGNSGMDLKYHVKFK